MPDVQTASETAALVGGSSGAAGIIGTALAFLVRDYLRGKNGNGNGNGKGSIDQALIKQAVEDTKEAVKVMGDRQLEANVILKGLADQTSRQTEVLIDIKESLHR